MKGVVLKTVLLLSLLSLIKCFQTLYTFIPEHCEVNNVNKSLIDIKFGRCYKLSRLELYFNVSFSFLMDIVDNRMGQVKITGYQFRSNEYRKGPVEFMMGLCETLNSKLYDIPHMFANSNMHCPFKKGVNYYVYKLSPNATNFPPLLPEGRWKLQLDFMYLNRYVILSVEWYGAVEYPDLFHNKRY